MPPVAVALRVWFAVVLSVAQFVSRPPEFAPVSLRGDRTPAAVPLANQAIRISQVFANGSTAAGSYPCDFIELFNAGDTPISLTDWSVQYSSSSGWWLFNNLNGGTIASHGYFLIAGSCPSTGTISPAPDFTGGVALVAPGGRVAIANEKGAITGIADVAVVDFVGYGTANSWEGSGPAPALPGLNAAFRADGGCTDTDDNAADFATAQVAPRNSQSPLHSCADTAPTVLGTTPAQGATNVARDASIAVEFSEPVTLGANWFEIVCDLSGTRSPASATVTGGPVSYTVDPNVDFYADDACRMTIFGDTILDNDGNPPDAMAANYAFDFRTVAGQCGDPAYTIHGIQGSAASSPSVGQLRTIEGVVTGDFQGSEALSGYFLQEEATDVDADPATSEAIFVGEHSQTLGDVMAGGRVRVTATVGEVEGMTMLTGATRMLSCPAPEPLAPVDVTLPFASLDQWEPYEGMFARFNYQLSVADTADLAAHGRVTLVRGAIPVSYTQKNNPNTTGYAAWENEVALRTVVLDDGSRVTNPDPIKVPQPGLTAANTLRAGDAVEPALTGVIDNRGGTHVVHPLATVAFTDSNPRVSAPARTAGNVRVAFLSLNDYFNVTSGPAGPRGASSAEEFLRQRDKVVQALVSLNADVITVSKLENDGFAAEGALADLAAGLNAASGAGTYAFVDPGLLAWGSDAVTVGALYRVSSVVPIGAPASLATGAFDQESSPPLHRAPMAMTFEELAWGERFTVVVNEWHGRTACPASGADSDAGDGQACWNGSRTAAANGLASWLALDPTDSGDPDILVLGELNALRLEDPIRRFTDNGYVDTIGSRLGTDAVTALVGARAGYVDHALASPALASQVVGASIWSINAEEPPALDYQMENKSPSQQNTLYAADAFRSSDHNPLIVDLSLLADQSDLGGGYGMAWHTGQGVWRLGQAWSGEDDGAARDGGSWNDGQGELLVSVNGPAEQLACLYGWLDFSDGTAEPNVVDQPDGDWDANENVFPGVPLSPGVNQLVTFPLPDGVISPGTLNMRIRLVPAPEPLASTCPTGSEMLGSTGRADGGEVEDYSFEPGPLGADVLTFDSRSEGQLVVLTWETMSEHDLAGFDLDRAGSSQGPWERVNAALIPALAPGAGSGGSYQYDDEMCSHGTWFHRLTAVDLDGRRSVVGLAQTRVSGPNALQLADFRARPAGTWTALVAFVAAGLPALLVLRRRRVSRTGKNDSGS